MMLVHVAGEPSEGVQKCRFCGHVLCDNRDLLAGNVVVAIEPGWTQEQINDALRPLWWTAGGFIFTDGNVTGVTDIEDRLAHACATEPHL